MFDLRVFSLTAQTMGSFLLFLSLGYFLRRKQILPKEAATTLSVLVAHLFGAAYSVESLSRSFTVSELKSNLSVIAFSVFVFLLLLLLSHVFARLWGRGEWEKRSLIYVFLYSNYGYLGYPLIQDVFGDEVLGKFVVFALVFNLTATAYGYALLSSGTEKIRWKKMFLSTPFLALALGCFLGLTGLGLPDFLSRTVSASAACMSPASMILAGLVLGGFSLKELVCRIRPYLFSLFRLMGETLVVGIPLYLLGLRGLYLFLVLAYLSFPVGLNTVVYPESAGQDASENARLCFLSLILSLFTLPIVFALLPRITGL